MDNIFLPKKKLREKKKKWPPYWLQKRTPSGPETEVFLGWPKAILSGYYIGVPIQCHLVLKVSKPSLSLRIQSFKHGKVNHFDYGGIDQII